MPCQANEICSIFVLMRRERPRIFPLAPLQRGEGSGEGLWRLAVTTKCNMNCNPHPSDSMPSSRAAKRRGDAGEPWASWVPPDRRVALRTPRHDRPAGARLGRHGRPGIPLQAFEKVESAPGIATAPAVAARPTMLRDATRCVASSAMSAGRFGPPARQPTAARKTRHKPLKRLNPRPGLRRPWPSPRAQPCFETRRVASRPQHERGTFRSAASAADGRPGNPPQTVEKVESAPGNPIAATAPGGGGAARDGRRPNGASGSGPAACRPAHRRTTARKIRRNALKRLNPRPGTGGDDVPPSPELGRQAALENAGIWSKFMYR